jgi:glyoxylase-like metal-dependent hydrolase (beta-lactamase superfamily II)
MLPSDIRDWRAKIASVSQEPIALLIQTDYDQARAVGPAFFDEALIAHDCTWDRLKIYSSEKTLNQINGLIKADGGKRTWRARGPDITFSDQLLLHKGERDIYVLYGGGHSCATSMVYLPEHQLVFSGDLVFCNQHPTMNLAETQEWVTALERLSRMKIETLIPGHGPVCTQDAAQPLAAYIRKMRQRVQESFESGKSKSETSAAMMAEFLDTFPYTDQERDERRQRIKGGSDRIYDEFRAAAKAKARSASDTSRGSRRRSNSSKHAAPKSSKRRR